MKCSFNIILNFPVANPQQPFWRHTTYCKSHWESAQALDRKAQMFRLQLGIRDNAISKRCKMKARLAGLKGEIKNSIFASFHTF